MKGISKVVEATKKGNTPLYYSIAKDTVYPHKVEGAYYLTDLIKPHTPEMVKNTVRYFMAL